VIELDTLRRAAELADVAADLEADIAERGLVNNSSVLRLVQVQKAIIDPVTPAVELELEVQRVRERRPGSKVVRMKRCERLRTPLACASPASRMIPADAERPAEARERVGRAAGAGVDRSLAVPHKLLRQRAALLQAAPEAPEDVRASLEKISAPATMGDQHSSAVTTHPRRVCPCPTGTSSRGSHRSHWTRSPGR
jgi:hypothetical protein